MPAHFGARQFEPGASGWYHDIAEPADIDRAWMAATSLPIGPFGLIDEMGNDRFLDMCRQRVATGQIGEDDLRLAQDYLGRRDVAFYTYPDPEYARAGFVGPEHPDSA